MADVYGFFCRQTHHGYAWDTGWWFQIFVIFTLIDGEDEPILTSIFFSLGLVQPLTSNWIDNRFLYIPVGNYYIYNRSYIIDPCILDKYYIYHGNPMAWYINIPTGNLNPSWDFHSPQNFWVRSGNETLPKFTTPINSGDERETRTLVVMFYWDVHGT